MLGAETAIPESALLPDCTPGWVSILAKAAAVGAFCAIIAGSAVTSTRSGLADEHWPSFGGQVLPSLAEMGGDRGLFYEHAHRTIVAAVGILTLVLAASLWIGREPRRWVRGLGAACAVAILFPALLGGLTVLLKLPPQVSILHVSLAMAFLGLTSALAVVTGRRWSAAGEELRAGKGLSLEDSRWLVNGALFSLAAVYAQIILGALPRHMHVGVIPHILWAFGVFTAVVMVATRVLARHSHLPGLFRPSMALFILVAAQFFLGFTTFLVRPDRAKAPGTGTFELFASLHQASGALMLAASVVLALRALQLRHLVAGAAAAEARA